MPRYFVTKKDGCYWVEDTVAQVTVILGSSKQALDYVDGIHKQNQAEGEPHAET